MACESFTIFFNNEYYKTMSQKNKIKRKSKKIVSAFSVSPFHPTPSAIVIQPATRRGRVLCRVKPPSSVISIA